MCGKTQFVFLRHPGLVPGSGSASARHMTQARLTPRGRTPAFAGVAGKENM
jgi:hypothetical protein